MDAGFMMFLVSSPSSTCATSYEINSKSWVIGAMVGTLSALLGWVTNIVGDGGGGSCSMLGHGAGQRSPGQ